MVRQPLEGAREPGDPDDIPHGEIAAVETGLRLAEVIYAPFYALFIVGPVALLVEQWMDSRKRLA